MRLNVVCTDRGTIFRRTSARRRGSLTVEMLLVLPIVLAFFLGMIEFSLILYSRQQLVGASREGCRVAALGGDQAEVERAVKRYLGTGRLGDAWVRLTDGQGRPIPSARFLPPGEPVQVWVELPTAHAVPDLLRFLGYSIRDDELVARTVMRRE